MLGSNTFINIIAFVKRRDIYSRTVTASQNLSGATCESIGEELYERDFSGRLRFRAISQRRIEEEVAKVLARLSRDFVVERGDTAATTARDVVIKRLGPPYNTATRLMLRPCQLRDFPVTSQVSFIPCIVGGHLRRATVSPV